MSEPSENDLDLAGLNGNGLIPLGGVDPNDPSLPTMDELEDPENARDISFLSGSLEFEEHMKQAAIRADGMLGEIADASERQAAAAENMATCFSRLLDLLEPVAATLTADQEQDPTL